MKDISNIISGGGWKDDHPRECRVKVKALCCLVLAVGTCLLGVQLMDRAGLWIFIVPAVFCVAAVALFWREPAIGVPGPCDGAEDPRNLYSAGPTLLRKHRKESSGD